MDIERVLKVHTYSKALAEEDLDTDTAREMVHYLLAYYGDCEMGHLNHMLESWPEICELSLWGLNFSAKEQEKILNYANKEWLT